MRLFRLFGVLIGYRLKSRYSGGSLTEPKQNQLNALNTVLALIQNGFTILRKEDAYQTPFHE